MIHGTGTILLYEMLQSTHVRMQVINKIICNRTFLGGMKHASKYFNDWTVNFWSKIRF